MKQIMQSCFAGTAAPLLLFGSITLYPLIDNEPVRAQQIVPDGTLSTTVTTPDGSNFTIENGNRAGGNLFHSFSEFSVPNGGSAFFNNAADVQNIINRVTGGSVSNIDGLIRANGNANLFLLNPAGIIFGPNASLNIGGSFFGSTADSLVFPEGEFSATDTQAPPLLTINAPIGLNFRDNPAPIEINSIADAGSDPAGFSGYFGLRVPDGKSFTLAGGEINADGGGIISFGGRIELGAVGQEGTVGLNLDGDNLSLTIPDELERANVSLTNGAGFLVAAGGGGDIVITAKNINVSDNSRLTAGILGGLGSVDARAGDITLNATESVSAIDSSQISNNVRGQGNGGNVNIIAKETVSFDGRDENDSFPSGIFTSVGEGAVGNAGDINITTGSLRITNRAQLASTTRGMGNAGNIYIDARDEVSLSNSILISEVTEGTGMGDGGNIIIKTGSLLLLDGSALLSDTENIGNAGDIIIEARDRVILEGEGPSAAANSVNIVPNQITATVDDYEGARGEGGDINISTPSLTVKDNGFIRTRTFGQGNAGDLTINAQSLNLSKGGRIDASTFAEGDGGKFTITASEIKLSGSGGRFPSAIFASAIEGTGNAGNLTITTDKLIMEDEAVINVGNFIVNFAGADPLPILPGTGAAGTLNIKANSIEVNNGTITAANASGIGGELVIDTNSLTLENGASISASTTAEQGQGGVINLNVNDTLLMRDNSLISARADSGADGGNINIDAEFVIAFPSQVPNDGNDIIASAVRGRGGNININTQQIFGLQERRATEGNGTNDIDASSEFGLSGQVVISNLVDDVNQGVVELPDNVVEPETVTAQACPATGRVARGESNFTITGRGGLPALATDTLTSDQISIEGEDTTQTSKKSSEGVVSLTEQPNSPSFEEIVPARGMIVNEKGEVVLTAYPIPNTSQRTPTSSVSCTES